MSSVTLSNFELDRCYADGLFWFDDLERVTVLAAAKREAMHPVLHGLIESLFGK
ncbi:MAG: hypothetical protein WKG01_37965 [Kofleriaceae bacterium]